MRTRTAIRMMWSAALAGCLVGGCRCSRDVAVNEDTEIDKPKLIEAYPEATPPNITFPSSARQQDPALNAFVERVLKICYQGDYDAFRQLFGTVYKPTAESDFERVWKGVQSIEVTRILAGPEKEPHYYVLAKVRLREPDKKNRQERTVPVMVFKEGDEWRLGPPSQTAIDRLRALESLPTSQPASRAVG